MARTVRKKIGNKKTGGIREAFQTLLRARVRSGAERKDLAKALGLSTAAIESMVYHGKGGLDAWIAALVHCYKLNAQAVHDFLLRISNEGIQSMHPDDSGERLWHEVSLRLSTDRKFYWASLIDAAEAAEDKLRKQMRTKGKR